MGRGGTKYIGGRNGKAGTLSNLQPIRYGNAGIYARI